MRIHKPHLIADVELDEVAAALSEWRWFLGGDWSPLFVSAVGDIFLINPSGEVARLDTGTASLEKVAGTRDDFEVALNDPGVAADWLLEPVVDELRAEGKLLGTGECYGFTILPIFKEGEYGAANRFCLSVREHIRFTGDLHLQLKDVSDGQSVQVQEQCIAPHRNFLHPVMSSVMEQSTGTKMSKLETSRLQLRPYEEADLRDALAVLGDRETMSFYPQVYSEEQVRAMLLKNIETHRHHGYGLFAVIEKLSGEFIGDCGITIQDIDGKREYEVGYRIDKSRWGRGYAHEAAAAVVKYGFEVLALARLCSYMASDHRQSRRIAEKLGMTLEKQYRNPRNRGFLTCVYAIHRDVTA